MNLNLLMAGFWLLLGAGLILWSWLEPDQLRIRGTNLSAGWLVLLLAAYNLIRWWSTRSYVKEQRALREAMRQRRQDRSEAGRPAEYDPTFDFNNSPQEEGPDGQAR